MTGTDFLVEGGLCAAYVCACILFSEYWKFIRKACMIEVVNICAILYSYMPGY